MFRREAFCCCCCWRLNAAAEIMRAPPVNDVPEPVVPGRLYMELDGGGPDGVPMGVRKGVPLVSVDDALVLYEGRRWSLPSLAVGEAGAGGMMSWVGARAGGDPAAERSRSRTYMPSNLGLVG